MFLRRTSDKERLKPYCYFMLNPKIPRDFLSTSIYFGDHGGELRQNRNDGGRDGGLFIGSLQMSRVG
jgi:hypothetical protein